MDAKTLALYLGCEVSILNTKETNDLHQGELSVIDLNGGFATITEGTLEYNLEFCDFKLILRPLSSITTEEMNELVWGEQELRHASLQKNPALFVSEFQYLLSKGFDLFGLIEKGEAIEDKP